QPCARSSHQSTTCLPWRPSVFPLERLRGLFLRTLNIPEEEAVVPHSSPYFIALGAIWAHPGLTINYNDLANNLKNFNVSDVSINNLPPLFADAEEYEKFCYAMRPTK
ncbi:MAG: hypothetical protein AB9858_11400, partial [Acidaminococcaceae bacterium]